MFFFSHQHVFIPTNSGWLLDPVRAAAPVRAFKAAGESYLNADRYLKDEISNVSPTLVFASQRLSEKRSFLGGFGDNL